MYNELYSILVEQKRGSTKSEYDRVILRDNSIIGIWVAILRLKIMKLRSIYMLDIEYILSTSMWSSSIAIVIGITIPITGNITLINRSD